MLAGEGKDRFYIAIRVARVWNVPSALKCVDVSAGKRGCKLDNHRSEGRRALITECEKSRPRKVPYPFHIERQLLCIACLLEKRWRVFDHHLLNSCWQLSPGTWPERNDLDEPFGGAGMISGINPFDNGMKRLLHLLEKRAEGGVIGEQGV
jgi:hypothetical protein